MLTFYDYAVIAFYFLFMLLMGCLTSRFVKTSSDYFRGGGKMLWWLVGAGAFMTQFSAWTFTGAASKAYTEGWPILVIYVGNAIGFFANAAYFAPRARQMRLITAIQGVRLRFSAANEQVFTWLQVPLGTLYAGIWLNGLCVFLSAAFGFELEKTIILTGLVVVAMTLLGGSWAAIAGDFIQMLILMPVTVVAAFLSLNAVGGIGAFVERLPAGHLDIGAALDSPLMMFWVIAILVKQFVSTNNLLDASRYLCVKDGSHARRAATLAAVLFLIGPVFWFIPPMAASILHPDLGAIFPSLKNPAEGAFLAISLNTMPAGMIGLLICGILAATMSSMDSGLNKNAGFFVKNFYFTILRPHATERELVVAGKTTTAIMGLLVILAGINFSRMQDIGLFDLMLGFSTLIAVPYAIPLVLCMFIKRTPPWSGWSTVIVCLIVSMLTTRFLNAHWLELTLNLAQPLTKTETSYWTIAIGLSLNLIAGVAWFFGSILFWKRVSPADQAQIDAFNVRMRTPVNFEVEEGANNDYAQASLLGNLSLAYGAFINLLALIPNPMGGRLGFIFCGCSVMAVGFALKLAARRSAPAIGAPSTGNSVKIRESI